MQVVQHLEEGRWIEFVEQRQGNIFHTPETTTP